MRIFHPANEQLHSDADLCHSAKPAKHLVEQVRTAMMVLRLVHTEDGCAPPNKPVQQSASYGFTPAIFLS
jgi:hypothetical protein